MMSKVNTEAANSDKLTKTMSERLSGLTKYLGTPVKDVVKKYNQGLFGLVVGLITLGLEILLNDEVFRCPQSGYQMYGTAFFTVPAILLLFLNILTVPASGNIHIWTLCESCCVKAYRRYGDVISGCFSACAVGLVAPTAWVFLSFLNSRHLVCWELGYQFGDNVTVKYINVRGFSNMTISDYEYKIEYAKGKSQAIGVIVLGVAVLCMTIFIVARRSCLKPYDAKERLPGLWEFEKKEALAASNELRRLLDEDDDEERFTGIACILEYLIIMEEIKALEDEQEMLKKKENEEKKADKVTEIQLEIKEFEDLQGVIKAWSEYSNLMGMKEHGGSVTELDVEEAKSVYEEGKEKLIKERERRIEAAKSALESWNESGNKEDYDRMMFHSWLIDRLLVQHRYFNVERFMEWWNSSKPKLKDLRSHFLDYIGDGYADSPQARGRYVASYIMQLYRRQNPYCRSAQQVIRKFRGIYPRAASSHPGDRYVNVNDYMYKRLMDPDEVDAPQGSGREVRLTQFFVKEWTEAHEQKWKESRRMKKKGKIKNHDIPLLERKR